MIAANTKHPTHWIKLAALWPKVYRLTCCYCSGRPARNGRDIGGEYAHDKCHTEACQ